MMSGSDYRTSNFTNKAFQQKWIAAGDKTPDLAQSLGWNWRYLKPPPAHTPVLSRGWVRIIGKGEFSAMEVPAGTVEDINDPYWPPYEYIIGSCGVARSGEKVDMVFSPEKDVFACLPVVYDKVK
jgi:hypothetical protein